MSEVTYIISHVCFDLELQLLEGCSDLSRKPGMNVTRLTLVTIPPSTNGVLQDVTWYSSMGWDVSGEHTEAT